MKSAIMVSMSALVALLFLGACSSPGISSEEYAALQEKYDSLQADYDELKQQNELLKVDVETAAPIIDELQTRINIANAYSEFFDIYVDTWRWQAGQPAKYGFISANNPGDDYLNLFHEYAYYAGGDEFSDRVEAAFHLPPGEEKDRAFAEFHIHLAEALMDSTSVEFEFGPANE